MKAKKIPQINQSWKKTAPCFKLYCRDMHLKVHFPVTKTERDEQTRKPRQYVNTS